MGEDILRMLCRYRYRDRDINLQQLRAWLDHEGTRIEAKITRGQLLKLKRGGEAQSNGVIAQLLPACECCFGVGSPKQFVSRLEYQQYSQRRDAAVSSEVLVEVSSPPFDFDGLEAAGSAMYYCCARCHSIWVFIEPERMENGSWNRII
ncbi:hypothetical protein [Burkholderia sp. BCC0397]|uniref:hypothetical protein n=1 Tax=Burkholderia sp. BCC0397 TaxID=486876 RepID=UPI00158AA1F9|nr:hypothetical protein [Burkholderia sp. BCC0397]